MSNPFEHDDGEETLTIDLPEDFNEEKTDSKYCIVAKVINGRQYGLGILHNILQRAWRPSGDITVSDFGLGIYMIKFALRCDYFAVIEGSPWSINNDLLLFELCEPGKLPSEYTFQHAVFTIQIHGLPINHINEKTVSHIAARLGTPLPSKQGESVKWGKYARVRVKLDITKSIRQKIKVTLPSKKVVEIDLRYEKLPRLCFYCGLFGHLVKQCPILSRKLEGLEIDLEQGFEQKAKELKLARFTEDIQANFRSASSTSSQLAGVQTQILEETPEKQNRPSTSKESLQPVTCPNSRNHCIDFLINTVTRKSSKNETAPIINDCLLPNNLITASNGT
ncbi:uncharacterized protein At4g02000-like [Papaver somniferum]|uniref:uncharacterized protein At4g02000-like n=1 Tax=Papaver somniferum TaxID=3469 RepID=UPI000E6FA688|nr:uncharacterized protein At4g02000-like [Papaver somniferum]